MFNISRHWRIAALLVSFLMACTLPALACAPDVDPFAVGALGTPTATALPNETPVFRIDTRYQLLGQKEPLRIARWDDKGIDLENFIVGYILVHGFEHNLEVVPVEQAAAGDALLKGDVDILLEMPGDWYEQNKASGKILDAGSLFEADKSLRIGLRSTMQETSPHVIEMLKKTVPGDQVLTDLESQITEGRVGVKANVVGIIYLRQNEAVWTNWVDSETAQMVKTAIEKGSTGLIKRLCVPDGGNDNCR